MQVIRGIEELQQALSDGRPAFVPTMGALHAGHIALVQRAVELSQGRPVVVSIFVNPTQFGPSEDFSRYPRTFEADVAKCESAGASVVFAPDVDVIYPSGTTVSIPPLPAVALEPKLEDAHRPTHFAGVCQVVARLFDIVQPAIAVFGEKDYQQLLVIKAMVEQAHARWAGLQIIPHPTVREPDGLAMSSRNMYLKHEERSRALSLFHALRFAQQRSGSRGNAEIESMMRSILTEGGLEIDYAVIRDAASLLPTESAQASRRALVAARLDKVRLIDNCGI